MPEGGIEPPLSCENQILSLTRLPIPPSGQLFKELAKVIFSFKLTTTLKEYPLEPKIFREELKIRHTQGKHAK